MDVFNVADFKTERQTEIPKNVIKHPKLISTSYQFDYVISLAHPSMLVGRFDSDDEVHNNDRGDIGQTQHRSSHRA